MKRNAVDWWRIDNDALDISITLICGNFHIQQLDLIDHGKHVSNYQTQIDERRPRVDANPAQYFPIHKYIATVHYQIISSSISFM